MGIGGLNTFIEDNYRWLSVPIGSIKRLVIDGNNLSYILCYRHEWVMGGDYPGIYKTVTEFVDKLKKLGICLDVILDGIDREEKCTNVRNRREKRLKQILQCQAKRSVDYKAGVLPLFARLVFLDALQDAHVPFHIADGEADAEIVAIANFYGCPVLADDSDFYIFNVKGGYIPLRYFFKALGGKEVVRVYNITSMAEQFKFQDPDLRLLIPAILGNDYIKRLKYPDLDNPGKIFQSLSQCLSAKQYLDSVPDSDIHENYSKAAKFYNVKLERNPAELSEVTSLDVPKWILERYREGCFAPGMVRVIMTHRCILPVVVDDMRSECAHHIGLRIRRFTYGILNCKQPVQETIRDNGTPPHLIDNEVHCLKLKPPVSLEMIFGLEVTERIQILCSVLYCCELIDCIPSEWKLVIASCIYWYKKAKPTPKRHLLRALVQCLIVCRDGHVQHMATSQAESLASKNYPSFLETLHAYAQWQCTYGNAVALNQLLMEPFEYVSPAFLYSGRLAMHYAAICSQSQTCELTQDQNKLYHHLMQPFTEKLVTTAARGMQATTSDYTN